MGPYWLLLLWMLQARDSPAHQEEEQKQVSALVTQIRRLAASEPLVYGIDTRLRTAEVLTGKYPKIARDLLRDAEAAASGVDAPAEQDGLRVRMVQLMAPLDLDEAERLIRAMHRERRDEDNTARAYDSLADFVARNHGNAREMIAKGLQAGGFRSANAAKALEDAATADPASATSLFAQILGAFPTLSPGEQDVYYLLERTKQIAAVNRTLAVEAIDKALSAAVSEKLQFASAQGDRKAAREKVLREIAVQLGSLDPELLERYKAEHKELDLPPAGMSARPEDEQKQNLEVPELSGLPYSEALSQARKLPDAGARTAVLIEISRREGISSQQRETVASEALSAASAMPLSNDRLLALAMISRDFARNNEPANAAFAAQVLSETYSKACACGHAECKLAGEQFDCLGMVQDFAKYLDEFKITPESMNLDNLSLQARLLILKLYPLLGFKRPSLWSLGN